MSPERYRLRLKLPNGAELEAEGDAAFVQRERSEFIIGAVPIAAPAQGGPRRGEARLPEIHWNQVTESRGRRIQLRGKLRGDKTEKDACLVLLAASEKLINEPRPTAAMLAKWLRASGYPVGRMDRALQAAIERGEILSSGSRRARRYELTGPGRLKAHLMAEELTAAISGF